MSTTALPNFFLAGAPKAGTTSLYHHLRQHPQIYMCPVKEPSYFSHEARLENFSPDLQSHFRRQLAAAPPTAVNGITAHHFITSWEQYTSLFQSANGARAIGEASVSYLWSRTAAREIAARTPQAKILLVLRHPAERAYSQYLHALSDGHVSHSFRQHIAEGMRASTHQISLYHPFLESGLYAEQVERFFANFPRQQVRIWLYEDTLADPAAFLRQVLSFLNVDPAFTPDTSRRLHQVQVPRALPLTQSIRRTGIFQTLRSLTPAAARPLFKRALYRQPGDTSISPEDRRLLVSYYHDDVRRLERVIERDLTHWLS